MKRYVIKSKFRFLLSMSALMILALSSVFILVVSARENREVPLIPEYVEEGDTIWGMSVNYAGEMDIREYISKVMEINNLKSPCIRPGDLLYFPKYD